MKKIVALLLIVSLLACSLTAYRGFPFSSFRAYSSAISERNAAVMRTLRRLTFSVSTAGFTALDVTGSSRAL